MVERVRGPSYSSVPSVISRVSRVGLDAELVEPAFDAVAQQLVEQILGRQVDGDAESMAARVERGDRSDAALENEIGEGTDQAALLGDLDELDRRNRPSRRMIPSCEHLGAGHHVGDEVELGLEVELDAGAVDGGPEIGEHRQPGRGAPIDLVSVELVPEMVLLGVVHRDVGAAEQVLLSASPARRSRARALGVAGLGGDSCAGVDDQSRDRRC